MSLDPREEIIEPSNFDEWYEIDWLKWPDGFSTNDSSYFRDLSNILVGRW